MTYDVVRCLMALFVLTGGANCYLTWIATRLPLEGDVAAPGALWPKPKEWDNNTVLMTIDPGTFTMTSDVPGCDVINSAISRYSELIKLDAAAVPDLGLIAITGLSITVADKNCATDYYPSQDMNESYTLAITSATQATLTARSIWGVNRGLETFSQLIYLTDDKKYHINRTSIADEPRFPYRGMMIDTARHFQPVPILMKILDAMSWDKFNVFHWHIVDDQSFPYPSRVYPDLQLKGSYTPFHRYSREDVTMVIREARLRGIRVIPEFDTPGHTWSWGLAYPELLTPCWGQGLEGGPDVPNYPKHGPREIMNPMEENTFQFLDNLYQEIIDDFPDDYVHLGMDEAYYDCWESNPNMTVWMAERNFTDESEVEQYFCRRLIELVQSKGSDYIIWQDPIDKGVSVDITTLVEVWKNGNWQEDMNKVVSQGYNAILSAPWYLNYISYGQDWRKYYSAEPHNFTADEALWPHVKGGEVCLWAEYVDGTNILSRLWPRASAVAERLWSPKTETDVESAKFRLDQHRCRYVRRGINAQPILNGYCGDYEWDGTNNHGGGTNPTTTTAPETCGQGRMSQVVGWVLILLSAVVMTINRSP